MAVLRLESMGAEDAEPEELAEAKREAKANPENAEAHETLGSLLAERGDKEEAMASLQRAASLAPSAGAEKFLYMAQLHHCPNSALECARTGASIGQVEDPYGIAPNALSLLAECLLPFASDANDAATNEALSAASHAASLDPRSPDPPLALGQVHAAHGHLDEALSHARASASKWCPSLAAKVGCKTHVREHEHSSEHNANGNDADDVNDEDDIHEELMPSFEQRFALAKLLLDCDTSVEAAVDVLEQLVDEQSESEDALYTLALAYHAGSRFDDARITLDKLPNGMFTDEAIDLRAAIDESQEAVKNSLSSEAEHQSANDSKLSNEKHSDSW